MRRTEIPETLEDMEFTSVLTVIATTVGVLLVAVLAIAPQLLELWEGRVDRHAGPLARDRPHEIPTRPVPALRDHYHRAA